MNKEHQALKAMTRNIVELDYTSPDLEQSLQHIDTFYETDDGDLTIVLEEKMVEQYELFLSSFESLVVDVDHIVDVTRGLRSICGDLQSGIDSLRALPTGLDDNAM